MIPLVNPRRFGFLLCSFQSLAGLDTPAAASCSTTPRGSSTFNQFSHVMTCAAQRSARVGHFFPFFCPYSLCPQQQLTDTCQLNGTFKHSFSKLLKCRYKDCLRHLVLREWQQLSRAARARGVGKRERKREREREREMQSGRRDK
jgi:hypothetical protein